MSYYDDYLDEEELDENMTEEEARNLLSNQEDETKDNFLKKKEQVNKTIQKIWEMFYDGNNFYDANMATNWYITKFLCKNGTLEKPSLENDPRLYDYVISDKELKALIEKEPDESLRKDCKAYLELKIPDKRIFKYFKYKDVVDLPENILDIIEEFFEWANENWKYDECEYEYDPDYDDYDLIELPTDTNYIEKQKEYYFSYNFRVLNIIDKRDARTNNNVYMAKKYNQCRKETQIDYKKIVGKLTPITPDPNFAKAKTVDEYEKTLKAYFEWCKEHQDKYKYQINSNILSAKDEIDKINAQLRVYYERQEISKDPEYQEWCDKTKLNPLEVLDRNYWIYDYTEEEKEKMKTFLNWYKDPETGEYSLYGQNLEDEQQTHPKDQEKRELVFDTDGTPIYFTEMEVTSPIPTVKTYEEKWWPLTGKEKMVKYEKWDSINTSYLAFRIWHLNGEPNEIVDLIAQNAKYRHADTEEKTIELPQSPAFWARAEECILKEEQNPTMIKVWAMKEVNDRKYENGLITWGDNELIQKVLNGLELRKLNRKFVNEVLNSLSIEEKVNYYNNLLLEQFGAQYDPNYQRYITTNTIDRSWEDEIPF